MNHGPWEGSAFLNYTHGYVNNTVSPSASVSPWTTVDVQIARSLDDVSKSYLLRGMKVRLSVINIFDTHPPYASLVTPIGYDTANADPRGRFISVSITKSW